MEPVFIQTSTKAFCQEEDNSGTVNTLAMERVLPTWMCTLNSRIPMANQLVRLASEEEKPGTLEVSQCLSIIRATV